MTVESLSTIYYPGTSPTGLTSGRHDLSFNLIYKHGKCHVFSGRGVWQPISAVYVNQLSRASANQKIRGRSRLDNPLIIIYVGILGSRLCIGAILITLTSDPVGTTSLVDFWGNFPIESFG